MTEPESYEAPSTAVVSDAPVAIQTQPTQSTPVTAPPADISMLDQTIAPAALDQVVEPPTTHGDGDALVVPILNNDGPESEYDVDKDEEDAKRPVKKRRRAAAARPSTATTDTDMTLDGIDEPEGSKGKGKGRASAGGKKKTTKKAKTEKTSLTGPKSTCHNCA